MSRVSRPALLLLLPLALAAQEAEFGISLPFTITGGGLATHRLQTEDANAGNTRGAFRAMLYPSIKLGSRWFVYSALNVSSTPFFYQESYEGEREIHFRVLQAFLGYTRPVRAGTLTVKAGQLSSAFGAFPLRFDDEANPLLDLPMSYGYYVKVRPDQLPCGINDFLHLRTNQNYDFNLYCGGARTESYGLAPVNLYGLPGAEVDVSLGKADARIQLTNSSPASPQNLLSESQHPQWTAGAGYSFWQGFRAGVSAYRGPYLERSVRDLLPAGKGIGDYNATGIGMDVQWAHGRWSASGEVQRFQFNYPKFRTSPAISYGYAEVKAVLTPRLYTAFRAGYQDYNEIVDSKAGTTVSFLRNRRSYEFAIGLRPNRWQLIKVGYEWLTTDGYSGTRDNVLGVQLVTSVRSLSKAFR